MKEETLISKLRKWLFSPAVLEYVGRSLQIVSSGGFVTLLFQNASERGRFFSISVFLALAGLIFHYVADSTKERGKS